jgi:hypothetical protein
MTWHHANLPKKKKFKSALSAGKVMATDFLDSEGLFLVDIIPQGTIHVCDTKSQLHTAQAQELTTNESVLLQPLGFDVSVAHPHAVIVRSVDLVRGKCHSSTRHKPKNFSGLGADRHMRFSLKYECTLYECVTRMAALNGTQNSNPIVRGSLTGMVCATSPQRVFSGFSTSTIWRRSSGTEK